MLNLLYAMRRMEKHPPGSARWRDHQKTLDHACSALDSMIGSDGRERVVARIEKSLRARGEWPPEDGTLCRLRRPIRS